MKSLQVRLEQLNLSGRTVDQLRSLLKKRQRKMKKRPPEERRRLLKKELKAIESAIAQRTTAPLTFCYD